MVGDRGGVQAAGAAAALLARGPAAQAPSRGADAQEIAPELGRGHRPARQRAGGVSDRARLAQEDLVAAVARGRQSRDRRVGHPPIDRRRRRHHPPAAADELGRQPAPDVGLVPEAPAGDARLAGTRVAAPQRLHEGAELGRIGAAGLPVGDRAAAARGPGRDRSRGREDHREAARAGRAHQLVERLPPPGWIGGRVGGVEPRGGHGRVRGGRDRRPGDEDPDRVHAQGLQLVERLLAHGRARPDQLQVVLEDRLLRGAGMGGGASRQAGDEGPPCAGKSCGPGGPAARL